MTDIRGPDYSMAEKDYMLGMKYKDIAEKYNVSINTVKSWKQRYNWNRKGVHTNQKSVHTKSNTESNNIKPVIKEVESVLKNSELNDKQRLFCLYYSKSFNATKSYQKAYGCSYETALTNGPSLLGNTRIKDEIYKLKKQRMSQAFLEPSDIFQKYMDIAFADITDYLEFGREEIPIMSAFGPVVVKDKETGEEIQLTKMVNTVKFKESVEVDGSIISEVKQGKDGASIKLADRMKALQWLSDHMDMATEEQRLRCEKLRVEIEKTNGADKDKPIEIVIKRKGEG